MELTAKAAPFSGLQANKKRIGMIELLALSFLAIGFMLYGLNYYLDLLLIVLIFGIFALTINRDVFYFYYFAVMFFEPVLILPLDLGSLFRAYQLFRLKRPPISVST